MDLRKRDFQKETGFGAHLRVVRKSRGMSLDAFADLLGTSKQVLSRYELGQRCPPLFVAWDFSSRLNIPLDVLVGKAPLEPYL